MSTISKNEYETMSDYLHSAAIVDANGKETPITDEMINTVCEKIERALTAKRQQNSLQRC